jgi:hopanoid biosynthesis associated RND transporter like protein HpnN
MREKLLDRIAQWSGSNPYLMLAGAVIVTLIAAGLAGTLTVKMNFRDMMPQDHPMVQEYSKIIEEYSAASDIIIAAVGEEESLKRFADEIVPRVEAMTEYIKRVDYKLPREFFLEHGFMLTKAKDLENSRDMFENLGLVPFLANLNDSFEKTYIADEESISNMEKENEAVRSLDGIKYWLETTEMYLESGDALGPESAEKAVDRFLIGDEYTISQDKDMLLIFASPTFSIEEMDKAMVAVHKLDTLIEGVAAEYPGLKAGMTGSMVLAVEETDYAYEDMFYTSIIAFLLIIALFILSFRMWIAPVLAGISLLMGVIWTGGFAALTVGSLNMMTSMFSVILIGLGIDFNIHIISAYLEQRTAGETIEKAVRFAFRKSGNGIVIGALTTALAFLTMLVAENTGMKELGLVAGSGVLFCMLAAILVLPSMLVARDKIMTALRRERYSVKSPQFIFLGRAAAAISRKPILVLAGTVMLTALFLYAALNVEFDYNYLNLEPKDMPSVLLQDTMIDEFDASPDMEMVVTSSVEESRRIAEKAKDLRSVGMVMTISDYVPSPEEQEKRLPHVRKIRADLLDNKRTDSLTEKGLGRLTDELYRVEDNVIELAQLAYMGGQDKVDKKAASIVGDLNKPADERKSLIGRLVDKLKADPRRSVENVNLFQRYYEPYLRKSAIRMTSGDPITAENLPENILSQFVSRDGKHFLVSIFPRQQVWDMEFLERFTDQMHRIDPRVTGMPLVFYILIIYIGQDGRLAAILTLIVVFLLLLIDFRSLRLAPLAMIPLVFGVIWMVGVMHLFGMKLNIVNVMAVPLILGIGIDDGVHLLHRYRVEGKGKIKTIFSSTGKAIALTSLTTMMAFGSMGFAAYRGLASLGLTLLIGVGTCFLTSIIILPAFLGIIDNRKLGGERLSERI